MTNYIHVMGSQILCCTSCIVREAATRLVESALVEIPIETMQVYFPESCLDQSVAYDIGQ